MTTDVSHFLFLKMLAPAKCFNWLCFFTGMFPFRVDIDEETGRFAQSPVSFLRVEIWWFTTILLQQIGFFYLTCTKSWPATYSLLVSTGHDSLPLISSSFGVTFILLVMDLIPRMLLFRFKDLRKAFELLTEIDSQMSTVNQKCCTTATRFRWGTFITLLLVYSKYIPSLITLMMIVPCRR